MKLVEDALVWLVTAVIAGLLMFIVVHTYLEHRDCEERGGVLLRKAVGAVCVKVDQV